MFNDVIVHDVGLRDGLQMEKQFIPLQKKNELINLLFDAGVDIIQFGSFVNPAKVPQMKDTDELIKGFVNNPSRGKSVISALVLNEKGLERGMDCGAEMFCMGVSASETHSMKNTGMTTNEALSRIIPMAKEAIQFGKKVQVSVQSAFGCGFEGRISEERVYKIISEYLNKDLNNISLADTAGHANPAQVERMFGKLFDMDKSVEPACHFHNTYGMGLVNIYTAVQSGVKYIETAFGGLGGCPFTKSPAGNVATDDFVHMIQQMGYRSDININKIIKASKILAEILGKQLPGLVYKNGVLHDQSKL